MARVPSLLAALALGLAAFAVVVPGAQACELGDSLLGCDDQSSEPRLDAGAADRLHQLLNDERARHGLGALDRRDDAARIAREHSLRMAEAERLWHNDDYFTAETRQALDARTLGENVALNGDVDDAHRRLMASDGHRANILSGSFTGVGIGVARTSDGVYYITQNFLEARPVSAPSQGGQLPVGPELAPVAAAASSPAPPAPSAPTPSAGPGTDAVPADEPLVALTGLIERAEVAGPAGAGPGHEAVARPTVGATTGVSAGVPPGLVGGAVGSVVLVGALVVAVGLQRRAMTSL